MLYIYIYVCIYIIYITYIIYIYIYIYEENKIVKIKDRVLRLRTKVTIWFTYLMLSRYQISWNWRHIKKCYFRRFCDLSLFIEQRLEFIYGSILIRFSKWLIFLNNLEKRKQMELSFSTQVHKCSSTVNCLISCL